MLVTRSYFFPVAVIVFLAALMFSPTLRAQEEHETLATPVVAVSDSGAYHAINQLPESIRSSAPFARDFYEFARHAGSSGVIDNDAYLSAYREAQQDMLRAGEKASGGKFSTLSNPNMWSNIGLSGNDTSNTPSAGITTAIVFDPQHANIMYAGGEGGVWKSYDTGATWNNLTDDVLPNLAVSTIAVDPVNTSTIYVGTGYCYASIPNYGGSGLYQSTDGGSTFNLLNVGTAQDFVKVTVEPSNHSIVLAASYDQGTVYRSTDAGGSWKSVFSTGSTWDIIATPGAGGGNLLYLIGTSGVFKSTNDGAAWTKISTSNFPSSIGRCAIASPTNAPNKLFALMTDPGGTNTYFYESIDTGKTWATDASAPTDVFSIPNFNHYQGWYDLYIAVTPNSITDDTIYLGGVVAYQKSGGNWIEYSDYNHSAGGGGYPHVDHHSFAINPLHSSIVYDGDDGGLWINYLAGSDDSLIGGGWQLHSTNMITNRFYHVGLDKVKANVTWAAAQDQGLWRLTDGSAPVHESSLGDAVGAIVSSTNSNDVYGEGPQGELYQVANLANPKWVLTADSAQGVNDAVSWEAPIAMAPSALVSTSQTISASSILYIGRQHLWQTTNGGSNWQKAGGASSPSYGITSDGVFYISAIGLPSWNDSLIYVAGGGSKFEMSTNFGTSWVARANPGTVTGIGTSPTNTGFVVVSLEGSKTKVMMSTDSGAKWTDVSGTPGAEIPGADANTACNVMGIAVDVTNPLTTWYAATDFGIYETTNAGTNWTWMGPGLIPCRDVQIASNSTTMRVATYGRGIWEVQLPISFSGVETNTLSATRSANGTDLTWNVENESSGAMFFVERSIDGDGFARIDSMRGMGATSGTHSYSYADNTTAPGTYLYRIHEIDQSGTVEFSNQVELHYGTNGLYLYQPYPNPFVLGENSASAVTLNFELPASDNVQLRIYDVKGTLIRTLVNQPMAGGPQSAEWNARDDAGNLVQSGAYFYSIQTQNSGAASGKIMVVRE